MDEARLNRILKMSRQANKRQIEPDFLGINTKTGVTNDGVFYEHKKADLTSVMRAIHERDDHLGSGRQDMKLKATVPTIIMLKWANEAGVPMYSREFDEVVKRKLEDPEFKAFRSTL